MNIQCSRCAEIRKFNYTEKNIEKVLSEGWSSYGDAFYCPRCSASWDERNGENKPLFGSLNTRRQINKIYGKKSFDDLISEGLLTKAARLFAKDYYESGKMGHTRKMLIEEMANRLDKYDKASRWMPVSEKLPKKGSYVLARFDDGFITGVSFEGEWELWADSGEVVAWLPMPKYKKEQKK